MTEFRKQIKINSSKKAVWQALSNIGDVYKFHPGVSNSYCTTDQVGGKGAVRVCELHSSGVIEETVIGWEDEKGFRLLITPVEKAPPVKNFTAKVRLTSVSGGQAIVEIFIQYDMKLGVIGTILNQLVIKSKMEEGISDLLQGLKIYLEKGMEIKDADELYEILHAA